MGRVIRKRPAQKQTKKGYMSHEAQVQLDPHGPADALALQEALMAAVESSYPSWTMEKTAEKGVLILHSAINAIQQAEVLPAFGPKKRLAWHLQVIRACYLRLAVENRYYSKLDTLNLMLPMLRAAHENLAIPATQRYKYTGPRPSLQDSSEPNERKPYY